jgi:hypothetical protein
MTSRDKLVELVSIAARAAVEDTGEASNWQELAELMLETIDRWQTIPLDDGDPGEPPPHSY